MLNLCHLEYLEYRTQKLYEALYVRDKEITQYRNFHDYFKMKFQDNFHEVDWVLFLSFKYIARRWINQSRYLGRYKQEI